MMTFRALLAGLLATIIAACAPQEPAADHVLTYASPYPPSHPFSRADIAWMKHVEQASGGRIAIKPYWAGSLISSEMSMLEIRHGLADIGLITPIYTRGGAHMLRAQSGFYGGVETIADQVAVYDCLANRFPAYAEELEGLHVLAVQGGNFPGIMTVSRPVRQLSDLKGLRLRAQSDAIDILRELGADPVNMPMGEVYPALAKGVIDGVVAPADTIKSLHFAEVARYFTTIRFSRGAYPARAMSDAAFRRLPPDLQQVVLESKPVWQAALNRELLKAEQAGIDYAGGHGVELIPVPLDEQTRFDELYNRFAMRQAKALSAFGLDGVPVLTEAQRLIASGARCAPSKSGNMP
jgi:TRAP-type transport system periplasmic protein